MAAVFAEMHGNPMRARRQNCLGGGHDIRLNDRRRGRSFIPDLTERGDVVNIDAKLEHTRRVHCRFRAGNAEEKR